MYEDVAAVEVGETISISIDQDWEVRNWTKWLGCTEAERKLAGETMGSDPDNVRRFIRQARC